LGLMGPKAKPPQGVTPVPQAAVHWQRPLSERFARRRQAHGRGAEPDEELFARASFEDPQDFPSGEPVAPDFEADKTADEASMMIHRMTGEGLIRTGFEPHRHSVIIAGRPTQVLHN